MDIFVGYDAREHLCFQVLEHNLVHQFGHKVHPIKHRELRKAGKFSRAWTIDEAGQYWDGRDGKPFSTEFSHTRFAAIPLAREMGIHETCMFVDCDFLFLRDPALLLQYMALDTALACVQYDWKEPEGKKMDGMMQLLYHRKLWSSMFLFNPDHPAHDWMTWHKLNWASGAEMHSFAWVPDDAIVRLADEWNYIPTFTDGTIHASAVHWSYGGPWMPGFEYVEHAQDWRRAYDDTLVYMIENSTALDPEKISHGRIT